MAVFTTYNPQVNPVASLVTALFGNMAGVTLVNGSVSVQHGTPFDEPSTIAFYDGSIPGLGIGAGLMLTSGDPTPPNANTEEEYGSDVGDETVQDADLQRTVDLAFNDAGFVEDVTVLQFQINVTDPAANGLRFDVMFGSEEYPFYIDDFVDVAGVYVNGVNYALFNNNTATPLSVVSANVNGGNFRDNQAGQFPIEYNAVSNKLQVTAPLVQGVNTIKIAIADTGDSILDSAVFVSGLQAVNYQGYGLSQPVSVTGTAPVTDTGGNQTYTGDAQANTVVIVSGQDVVDAGAGLDLVKFQAALAAFTGYAYNGSTLTAQYGPGNAITLANVERVQLGDGSYFALDTGVGGNTFDAIALLQAAFNHNPDRALLSNWVNRADDIQAAGGDEGDLAQAMINAFAPGVSNQTVISYLHQTILGSVPDAGTVNMYADMVGAGKQFATIGDLVAFASTLPQNTAEFAPLIGSIQSLDAAAFA